jgi:hypothetical protein
MQNLIRFALILGHSIFISCDTQEVRLLRCLKINLLHIEVEYLCWGRVIFLPKIVRFLVGIKVGYLSDIFSQVTDLNISVQYHDQTMVVLSEKITAFMGKLKL